MTRRILHVLGIVMLTITVIAILAALTISRSERNRRDMPLILNIKETRASPSLPDGRQHRTIFVREIERSFP